MKLRLHLISIFLFLFLIRSENGFSQCFTRNTAFKEGESLTYLIYYNWGMVWLNAGYVKFEVKAATYNRQPIYFFNAYGTTYKSYDWFFKVRDTYQAYLEKETLKPLWFYQNTFEGGYAVENKYRFDQDQKLLYLSSKTSKRPLVRDTIKLSGCTLDILSAVYFCRNLDITGLKKGDTIPVRAILDNEVFDVYVRYLGKETIEIKSGEKYKCIKFSALLIEGSIFKGGEDLYAWVTDDQNRIPVMVEAKILIGSVNASLSEAKGLRNPMRAKVE